MKLVARMPIGTLCALALTLALSFNAAAQKLELVVRTGHSLKVTSVAYSPDGKILASGSLDKTIKLWDVASGQEILTISGHGNGVRSVAFSPDGKTLASASDDATIKLWDVLTGKNLRTFLGHGGGVMSVAFSSDGRTLASGGEDNTIKLWDVDSGRVLRTIALKLQTDYYFDYAVPVAFSPNAKSFASASWDKKVWVWDTAGERAEKTLDGNPDNAPLVTPTPPTPSVAFSPKGDMLASGSSDNTIEVWDVAAGREIKTLGGGKSSYTSVVFSPGGEILAAGTRDNTITLWDTATWDELKNVRVADKWGWVNSIAFSPDGKTFASGSDDIRILDVASGRVLTPPGRHAHTLSEVVMSPDGKTVASSSSNDRTIKLWNLATGQELLTLKGHTSWILSLAFSPDGRTLASGSGYYFGADEIKLWDVATGQEIKTLRGHTSAVRSVGFSPDGKLLVSGSQDYTLKIWDVASGLALQTLKGPQTIGTPVALSVDGRLAASTTYDNEIDIWDVKAGTILRKLPQQHTPPALLAFGLDGKTLASVIESFRGLGGEIKLWGVENGAELKTLATRFPVNNSIVFGPDGKTLAASSKAGDVALFDLQTGVEVLSPQTPPQWCCPGLVHQTPRAEVLAVGDGNRIKLLDASTKKEMVSLIALEDGDWAVVSPDGRFDASDGAQRLMHYSYGLENITLEQLKEAYYEPGLLAKLLGYSKNPLRPIVPLLDVKLHPEVVEQRVEPDSAKLILRLRNRGGGIGEVRVLVNDKLAFEDARDEALRANPYVLNATLTVDLSHSAFFRGQLCDDRGENCRANKVTVVTSNTLRELGGRGNINSRGAEIFWAAKGTDEFTLPTLYAIVGGVSDYGGAESTALDLRFAAKDAEDFAAALAVGARRLFCPREKPMCLDKVQVKLLSTSGKDGTVMPTKENFRKAFEEVAQKARPEDILVVYFAGHGVTLGANTDTYMYLTQEARTASREDLAKVYQTTAITSEELTEWLTQTEWKPGRKGIAALKQVLILDTCAAGTAGEQLALTSKRELSSDQVRAIEFLKDRAGIHILMASTADQPSYEASQYGQGLLTYTLLQGLRGAALDKGDFVDVQTLFRYAELEVPHLAGSVGGVQKPVVKSPTGNTFLIGQMTDADKRLVPLSQVKPLMLRPRLGMGEENDDPLNLVAELRKRFDAESSYEVMRRSGKGVPILIYVDDDSFPGALRVTGTYTLDGDTVRVKAFLRRDGKTVAVLQEIQSNKDSVVEKLVAAVRAALAEVPPDTN
jgi:WD40 repeat protein/uncharacterized caspase-like protein